MNERLTLLQRGVIQRLRREGCGSTADLAQQMWAHGVRLGGVPQIHPRVPDELASDLLRADAQVSVE